MADWTMDSGLATYSIGELEEVGSYKATAAIESCQSNGCRAQWIWSLGPIVSSTHFLSLAAFMVSMNFMPLINVVSGVSFSDSSCSAASCQRSLSAASGSLSRCCNGQGNLEGCRCQLRWFGEGSERVGWTAWCWSRPKPVKRQALPLNTSHSTLADHPNTPHRNALHPQHSHFTSATHALTGIRCRLDARPSDSGEPAADALRFEALSMVCEVAVAVDVSTGDPIAGTG